MKLNFKHFSSDKIASLLPLAICFIFIALAIVQFRQLRDIENNWNHFQSEINQREIYFSDLKDLIGYGGAIHSFKNYVLRGGKQYEEKANLTFDRSKDLINKLMLLPTLTKEEKTRIQEIYQTIIAYHDGVFTAKALREKGFSTTQIDDQVKVQDAEAINAFQWLKNNQEQLKLQATLSMKKSTSRAKNTLIISFMLCFIFVLIITAYSNKKLIEARKKAEDVSTLKTNFLANMSHEIRTPMNGIIGFTGMLLDQKLPKEAIEQIRLIRNCGENLMAIINDILDFSKVEAGKLDIDYDDFDIVDCVDSTILLFSHALAYKSVSLNYDIDESIPKYIKGDSLRLKQILTNLIGNAVKFTESGEINVSVKLEEQSNDKLKVLFAVKDSGIGIPDEAQKRLFEIFEQAEQSTTKKYGGTGLGLSITRKLVNLMEGEIWLESVEGEGSTFYFFIPTEPGNAPIDDENFTYRSQLNKSADSKRLKILVAEDNKINQIFVQKILTKIGYKEVKIVENGYLAIEALKKAKYDVVFMDIQMPELDGYEATRIICQTWEKENRPMICGLSANAMKEDKEKALSLGMDRYLNKPIEVKKLRSILLEAALQKSLAADLKPRAFPT